MASTTSASAFACSPCRGARDATARSTTTAGWRTRGRAPDPEGTGPRCWRRRGDPRAEGARPITAQGRGTQETREREDERHRRATADLFPGRLRSRPPEAESQRRLPGVEIAPRGLGARGRRFAGGAVLRAPAALRFCQDPDAGEGRFRGLAV